MTQLHQILAVETGVKSRSVRGFTDAYHSIQRAPLLSGISRTYTPKDHDGDQLPPESQHVQVKVSEIITGITETLTRLFDVVLTKDAANQNARANVVLDGNTLLTDVPVTYLLFLEKNLIDVRTFVSKLPVLDPSKEWDYDPNVSVYRSKVVETTKSKKVPKNHIKSAATDKHPAQVELFHEDVIVGTWATTNFSGALPQARVDELLTRVDKLYEAVKYAREEANGLEITDRHAGRAIFEYIFAD